MAPEQLPPVTPASGDKTPATVERAKILIVDDEPFNVDDLEQELEDLGYETVSASNGQEALEKVAAEAPDLILLEVIGSEDATASPLSPHLVGLFY